jgi:hypothetical protein
MEPMTGKGLSNGIGVNFDENRPGTGVRVAYKDAVIPFQCVDKTLSQSEREGICAFLEERGLVYFTYDSRTRTVSAAEASALVNDLTTAGFVL